VCTRRNKEERFRSKTLSLHKNNVQSVAVGVSKLDYTGLTLVDPRVKITEILLLLHVFYVFIKVKNKFLWFSFTS